MYAVEHRHQTTNCRGPASGCISTSAGPRRELLFTCESGTPFFHVALVLDRFDLAGSRALRCHPDGIRHAFGRHAPRVGSPVHHSARGLVAVGMCNAARPAPRPTTSVVAMDAYLYLGHSHCGLSHDRSGLCCMERFVGSVAEPLGQPDSITLHSG